MSFIIFALLRFRLHLVDNALVGSHPSSLSDTGDLYPAFIVQSLRSFPVVVVVVVVVVAS